MAAVNKQMDAPPIQVGIRQLTATPEAAIYAPPGYEVIGPDGTHYIKTTSVDVNTGWEAVTTS